MDRLGAQDKKHLAHARRDGRVLVTHDDDFLRLAAEGAAHAGIVYVPRERSIGDIVRGLVRIARASSEEDLDQQIRFL
jgi:predicted nuclease of predicted toxin-antitoxin system